MKEKCSKKQKETALTAFADCKGTEWCSSKVVIYPLVAWIDEPNHQLPDYCFEPIGAKSQDLDEV